MGEMPLPNQLMSNQWDGFEGYDLTLELCRACELVQIQKPVDPSKMYSDYAFFSGVSFPYREHCRRLSERLLPTLGPKSLVVEIASNDGTLLDEYRKWNIPALGIEPARAPAEVAIVKGIPTIQEFFSFRLAARLPQADVIHAHNVLAHVPDLDDFVEGLRILMKPKGVAIVEVQALEPLLERTLLDNIYHEHLYYFTYTSLGSLFARHDLEAVVEEIPAHGGSLRCWVRKGEGWPYKRRNLSEKFAKFRVDAVHLRNRWHREWRYQDYAGFGASAKATAICNYASLDPTHIQYIVDETPAKQGKWIPGSRIPVVSPECFQKHPPAKVVNFAWNYHAEIQERFPGQTWLLPHE
jgi:SAM-dependent methyltransferase